jgi:hypothetical protein
MATTNQQRLPAPRMLASSENLGDTLPSLRQKSAGIQLHRADTSSAAGGSQAFGRGTSELAESS